MELNNRFLSDCVVVDIQDDQFGYPKTLVLKSHVIRLLQEGHRRIVLNLAQVEMLDSFGLAVLISLLKLCRKAGEPHFIRLKSAGYAPDRSDPHGSGAGCVGNGRAGRQPGDYRIRLRICDNRMGRKVREGSTQCPVAIVIRFAWAWC